MPWSRVRGARGWSWDSGPVPVLASPLGLPPALASLAVHAGTPCRYAMPCGLCVPQARSGYPSGPRRVSVACVCDRARAAFAPPPPLRVGVARALRAVPVQGAGRAVLGGSCPSAFPAPVPCPAYLALGSVARSLRALTLLGVARPPAGMPAFLTWLCALWRRHEGAGGGGHL